MIQLHPIALEVIANGGFPVKHLSYSSIKEYLANPRSFLKKYIRYEFDDTTGDAFMIGKSVHKGLEIYMKTFKESGEILDFEAVVKVAEDHFDHEVKIVQGKALTKFIQTNGGSFEWPVFTKELTPEEILTLYSQAFEYSKDFIELPEEMGEQSLESEIAWIDGKIKADIENTLIKLKKWQTFESLVLDAKDTIRITLENFFAEGDGIPSIDIHSTETEEKVFFLDENGDEMPVALKAISDRIDVGDTFCDITDYKTCEKFSTTDAEKADYEMQAGANYFTALVATGKKPRKMKYVEILKSDPGFGYAFDIEWEAPTPCSYKYDLIALAEKHEIALDKKRIRVYLPENKDQRLLKWDLEKLVADHGVIIEKEKPSVEDLTNALLEKWILAEEFGVTNTVEEMRDRLITAGILKKRPGVNVFEIDFEERTDVVATFLSLYKWVLNMIAISEMCGVYLPNISAQWGGLEAYQDFKDFDSIPKAPTIKKVVQEKEEEIDIL